MWIRITAKIIFKAIYIWHVITECGDFTKSSSLEILKLRYSLISWHQGCCLATPKIKVMLSVPDFWPRKAIFARFRRCLLASYLRYKILHSNFESQRHSSQILTRYQHWFIFTDPVVYTWSIIIICTFGDITIWIWWTVLITRWNRTFFPFELFLVVHCKTTDCTHFTITPLFEMLRNRSTIIFVKMIVCSLHSSILKPSKKLELKIGPLQTTDGTPSRIWLSVRENMVNVKSLSSHKMESSRCTVSFEIQIHNQTSSLHLIVVVILSMESMSALILFDFKWFHFDSRQVLASVLILRV